MLQQQIPQQKRYIVFGSASFVLILIFLTYSSLPARGPSSRGNSVVSTSSTSQQYGNLEKVNWSRFAYVQYVTTLPYLCNSVMLFERLHKLGSKADSLLLYSKKFSVDEEGTHGALLRKARDEYGAVLKPIEVQRKASEDLTWSESFTKLLVFNQTEYDRVLHLDSDSTILQLMDELFLLPPTTVAMPRSYWEAQEPHVKLSSQLLLATPSNHEYERCMLAVEAAGAKEYDMEIVNTLYRDTALVLPHDIYDLYTREFRMGPDHRDYLGSDEGAVWDPDEAVKRAKFLHFSDWPLPKPWIEPSPNLWKENMPRCFDGDGIAIDGTSESLCRERDLWVGFYKDFKSRRKEICGTGT